MDKRVFLKVKIKSLAEEARIIRKEEHKNKFHRVELYSHRIGIVRSEARHSLLAYGFLRGRAFSEIERNFDDPPDWKRIEELVKKYGVCMNWNHENGMEFNSRVSSQVKRFADWKTEAQSVVTTEPAESHVAM